MPGKELYDDGGIGDRADLEREIAEMFKSMNNRVISVSDSELGLIIIALEQQTGYHEARAIPLARLRKTQEEANDNG
jgi:hypothetical protein